MDQLTKHIQIIHSKSGHYKTVLYTNEIYYNVVTRVNYLSVLLWIEYVNSLIKTHDLTIDPINKPNWIIMNRSYRKDYMHRLNIEWYKKYH